MKPAVQVRVPPCEGRTLSMRAGQQLRVVAVEGPQAADLVFVNAEDHRESASAWLTRHMSGSFTHAAQIFTKLPAGRVMFDVEAAPSGVFWLSPGRCNRLKYARQGRPDHPNCQDILAEALAPHGFDPFDVPEVINLFMRAQLHGDGTYEFGPSPVEPGDYVALRARIDVLVAVSACPDDSPYNAGQPKSLLLEVWDQ
jgi:uncharacterized protein YcgI (DUF1989 family)